MSLTVKDALELKNIKELRLVAGESGLGNVIKTVGILEYELDMDLFENFVPGDFLVTTFLPVRDNPDAILPIIKSLNRRKVAALAIKTVYFKELSNEVIEYADENGFPIFMYDAETFTENVIVDIAQALKDDENNEYLVAKIYGLIKSKLSNAVIKKIAYEINSSFKERIWVTYLVGEIDMTGVAATINYNAYKDIHSTAIMFEEGVLLIHTSDNDASEDKLDHATLTDSKEIIEFLSRFGLKKDQFIMGISSTHNRITALDRAIKEALYSYRVANLNERNAIDFSDIGIYKMLLPILKNEWVNSYYEDLIKAIKAHDNKYDTELLETAITFVKNNGDYKRTAEQLFQHGNTIRYRISKIKELLNLEEEISGFYEQLAVLIRLHLLKTSGL